MCEYKTNFNAVRSGQRYSMGSYLTTSCVAASVPVAQWLEHCVSSAKVVGSIPREHMY